MKIINRYFGVICCVLIALTVFNLIMSFEKVATASASIVYKKTILIDVGHGGEDGGAIGVGGINEKDLNLPIALFLAEKLMANGYEVIITREEDVDLGDDSLDSVSERKKSDMQNRLEIINSSNADIAISIHQNYFEQSQYSGFQTFYASDSSEELAKIIQETVVEELQPDNNRLEKYVDSKYLLNNSQIPMVILECGFISNEEEAMLLQSEEYQIKLVDSIYSAIEKYFE
ncbi:MAG: N-acetylmuramoyl-L-alanine amidase [Clostridia bacterium]